MEIILAKDFSGRQELELKVSSLMGLTAEEKPNYVIKGTREELRRLHLGQGNVFWGIKVEEMDYQKPVKTKRVDRGEIHKSKFEGINIKVSEEA